MENTVQRAQITSGTENQHCCLMFSHWLLLNYCVVLVPMSLSDLHRF